MKNKDSVELIEYTKAQDALNCVTHALGAVLGAAVLGAHMEAPFLCEKYKGAQLGECLMNPSVEAYEAMTRGTDCVRMMTLAPELPGALGFQDQPPAGVVGQRHLS